MLVLDLTTCHVELEPLLHSTPQIFTIGQWEGVCKVPKEEHGYKITIAFKMVTHVLALLSHDNLWEFHSERWDDMIHKMLAENAPDDFSLGTNVKDQLDYGKHLRVHAQKEWHVNPRLAKLVREYNRLAINTLQEAQDLPLLANIFIKKTDITAAIHPFDLSNIAPVLLQFGHLGDQILDSYKGRSLVETKRWANLLANEIPENIMTVSRKFLSKPQKKLCQTLEHFTKMLPDSLSPFQRLALTPTPFNPITKYFQELRHDILKNMKGAKRSENTIPKLPFCYIRATQLTISDDTSADSDHSSRLGRPEILGILGNPQSHRVITQRRLTVYFRLSALIVHLS
ncbi:hypothetical protein DFH06DRAFT_1337513 [Mycena polygramma]|nr:hypothetical protein DFH06DRAFT_1337513 [Mycena polygramma]